MSGDRDRLAAEQAELLSALLGQGADPPGFAAGQLRVQHRSLLAKRRRVAARSRPDLVQRLGDRFGELFDRYAAENPRRTGGSSRTDADELARWLSRGRLLRWIKGRIFRRRSERLS